MKNSQVMVFIMCFTTNKEKDSCALLAAVLEP